MTLTSKTRKAPRPAAGDRTTFLQIAMVPTRSACAVMMEWFAAASVTSAGRLPQAYQIARKSSLRGLQPRRFLPSVFQRPTQFKPTIQMLPFCFRFIAAFCPFEFALRIGGVAPEPGSTPATDDFRFEWRAVSICNRRILERASELASRADPCRPLPVF